MDDSDRMPRVNIEKDGYKLTSIEKEYMQRMNQENLTRVNKWTKIRRKNRMIGAALSVFVVSVYSYSMWAIKQENFLDDFNEPEKISD